MRATTFLIGDYVTDTLRDNPVFTVADGVLALTQSVDRNSVVRKLQVVKSRGHATTPGLHTFRISQPGLEVFPRMSIAMVMRGSLPDCRVTHPDGSVHWIAARRRPYYADDGTPRLMVGTTQDITERKQQPNTLSQRYTEEHRVRTRIEQLSAEREAMLAHLEQIDGAAAR